MRLNRFATYDIAVLQSIFDWLDLTSLCYLSLPVLIFAWGWLQPIYALICTVIIALVIRQAILTHAKTELPVFQSPAWLILLTLVLIWYWVSLSGSSGHVFQNGDWEKHNAILQDLTTKHWPVLIHYGQSAYELVYYIAYYLPAALIGKLWGLQAAVVALYAWTMIGTTLAVLWFYRLIGTFVWWVTPLFIMYGGLDVLGYTITRGHMPAGTEHLGWWQLPLQYSSNTVLLFWVPQHALPAWIACGLITYYGWKLRSNSYIAFTWALSLLWSPFVFVGLAPFVLLFFWQNRSKKFDPIHLIGLALIVPLAVFFLSNLTVGKTTPADGFIWNLIPMPRSWLFFVVFYSIHLLIYAFFAWQDLWKMSDLRTKQLLGVMSLALLAWPLYRVGISFDFMSRASIPSLMLAAVFLARYLLIPHKSEVEQFKAHILIVLLLIGATSAGTDIARTLEQTPQYVPIYRTLTDLSPQIIPQYIGTQNSKFFTYFSKPVTSSKK